MAEQAAWKAANQLKYMKRDYCKAFESLNSPVYSGQVSQINDLLLVYGRDVCLSENHAKQESRRQQDGKHENGAEGRYDDTERRSMGKQKSYRLRVCV